jgi:arylsulfatase A-like enzyme
MSRFVFLVLGLLSSAGAVETRPNVVLFLVDDMGWRDSGAYGSTYYETPRLDAFAQEGVRFTSAYSQPLCSPTRASLLTGKYPSRHGITGASGHQKPQSADYALRPTTGPANQPLLYAESKNYLEPAEITLAEALQQQGYRTAHIGKWHLGLTLPHWPEAQGFDVTFHCHPDPGPPGGYFSPYGVLSEGEPRVQTKVGNITDGPVGEYIVDRQAAEAETFIAGNKGQPFFLNLWCYGVHGPWGHKEEYTRYFAKKAASGGQGNPIMASMLKSVDECFGRILDALEKHGLTENTIVIFNSDNGGNTHSNKPDDSKRQKKDGADPMLADWRKWAGDQPPTDNTPLRDGKGSLYEGGTRVPLIWRWPAKIKGGGVNDSVVAHIDVYPTVMELVGKAMPNGQQADGQSYAKLLKGEGEFQRDAFFNYFPHGGVGRGGVTVRAGNFKLIRWITPTVEDPLRFELYDLEKDLGEANNLAASMPDKVGELDAMIERFLQETGALYPIANPAYLGSAKAAPRAARSWLAKGCSAVERDGKLVITAAGPRPFLGIAGLNLTGPVTLSMQANQSGVGRVQWRTAAQEAFPSEGQIMEFAMPMAGTVGEVIIPVSGALSGLRFYLPTQAEPLALDWIELKPAKGASSRWDF